MGERIGKRARQIKIEKDIRKVRRIKIKGDILNENTY